MENSKPLIFLSAADERVAALTSKIANVTMPLKDIIDLLDRVSSRTFKARAGGRQALEAERATTKNE
jgi:hypothetical protein